MWRVDKSVVERWYCWWLLESRKLKLPVVAGYRRAAQRKINGGHAAVVRNNSVLFLKTGFLVLELREVGRMSFIGVWRSGWISRYFLKSWSILKVLAEKGCYQKKEQAPQVREKGKNPTTNSSNWEMEAIILHTGMVERIGRVKARKAMGWAKDSLTGKVKAMCGSKAKQGNHSLFPSSSRCSAISRTTRLHHA